MTKYLISIFIFCVVLFLYLHIVYQLKTSDDLEIYTIERPSKDKLEDICDLRQPVIFDFINEELMDKCNFKSLDSRYGAFDIKIRNTSKSNKEDLYVPLLMKESLELFNKDDEKKYITEKNEDFLEETCAIKDFRYNDYFLRPSFVAKCNYDIMTGSLNAKTPLRYDINYRNYYYVTSGEINIKLVSPQYTKYLYENKNYDELEFSSPLNLWDIQEKYKSDFNKIKVLEVNLKKGNIIYIPAYWWYTIEYKNISSICTFKYKTYMNIVAIFPHILTHLLQKQNIKFNSYNQLIPVKPKKEDNTEN